MINSGDRHRRPEQRTWCVSSEISSWSPASKQTTVLWSTRRQASSFGFFFLSLLVLYFVLLWSLHSLTLTWISRDTPRKIGNSRSFGNYFFPIEKQWSPNCFKMLFWKHFPERFPFVRAYRTTLKHIWPQTMGCCSVYASLANREPCLLQRVLSLPQSSSWFDTPWWLTWKPFYYFANPFKFISDFLTKDSTLCIQKLVGVCEVKYWHLWLPL